MNYKQLLHNSHPNHSLDEIYPMLDQFSWEEEACSFTIILPPLCFEGQFVKGLALVSGISKLSLSINEIQKHFVLLYNSLWSSYPRNSKADGLLTCYLNPLRESWFKQQFPHRQHQLLLPYQDADWTNEKRFYPIKQTTKDIDVLCVSRFLECKNLPIIGQSLHIYHKKYKKKLKFYIPLGDVSPLSTQSLAVFKEFQKTLGKRFDDYVFISKKRYYHHSMPNLYRRSKLYLLGSLLEGKNRALHEAMCCDVPVVTFKAFNQFARGHTDVFPHGAGSYAESFDAQCLADALHNTLSNLTAFSPRNNYLSGFSGRFNTFSQLLAKIPYYNHHLPNLDPKNIMDNHWLNQAIQHCYQTSLTDFILERKTKIPHHTIDRVERTEKVFKYFIAKNIHHLTKSKKHSYSFYSQNHYTRINRKNP